MKVFKLTAIIFFGFLAQGVQALEVTLDDLLKASKNHPDLKKSELQINKAQNNYLKISGEFGPQITLMSGLGPNKKTSGNALNSTQSNNVDTTNFLGKIDLKWPIFQFNRSQELNEANKNFVQIKEIELRQKTLELEKNAKQYFYGYQYAYTLLDFVTAVESDILKAIESMEKNKKNSSEDVLKLKIFLAVISAKKAEVEAGLNKATLGLRDILQFHNGEEIKLAEPWLAFDQDSFNDLAWWKEQFQLNNPELQMSQKALLARTNFQNAEEKSKLPMFGIFSSYEYLKTPGSTKQSSKFSYDPYHKNDFSIGVGLLWEFDFGKTNSQIKDAMIETELAKIDQNRAQKGLPLLLEKNFLDYKEAYDKAKSLRNAYKDSKKLLTRFQTEAAFGINSSANFIKDYVEAYTLRASIFKDFQEAVYDFELKKSELYYFSGITK